jgi:hypothetical protein
LNARADFANMSVESAERLHDVLGEWPTDEQAAQSIVDEYLECGQMYPRSGYRAVHMGDFLATIADDDDISNALCLIYDCDDDSLSNLRTRMRSWCANGAVAAWLIETRPDLVTMRADAMNEEAREAMEEA